MKTSRLVAVIALLLCAVGAAYFSYALTLAPPTHIISSSGGPPPGFSMQHSSGSAAGNK